MLYPHGPPPFVNSYSHEQDMQAVTHHVEKRERPCIQPPAKHNRTGNQFCTYTEVTFDEDISSEDFIYETLGGLPMTSRWTQQDQFEWSRTRIRADELYQHDQMSD